MLDCTQNWTWPWYYNDKSVLIPNFIPRYAFNTYKKSNWRYSQCNAVYQPGDNYNQAINQRFTFYIYSVWIGLNILNIIKTADCVSCD